MYAIETGDHSTTVADGEHDITAGLFGDSGGHPVSLHDRARVYWDTESDWFSGTIDDFEASDINADGRNIFHIAYDDGTAMWHAVDGDGAPRVEVLTTMVQHHTPVPIMATTRHRKKPWAPHPSVSKYITDGQINHRLIDGSDQLPPPPPLPIFQRHSAPPLPDRLTSALAGASAIFWLHAILKEMHGHLHDHGTWRWAPKHESEKHRHGLNFKWVFAYKWDDAKLLKFKARLVLAAWNMVRGVDYRESYSGTSPPSDLFDLEAVAVEKQWLIWESDHVQAYLSADLSKRPDGAPVVAAFPSGCKRFVNGIEQYGLVDKACYGYPSSGHDFAVRLLTKLTTDNTCPITLISSKYQPVIFYAVFEVGHKWHGQHYILWINNDNVRHYSDNADIHRKFMPWYRSTFHVTGADRTLQSMEPSTCLGTQFSYTPGITRITMTAYLQKLLAEHGMLQCNPVTIPLPAGYSPTKDDAPAETEERGVVLAVNEMFQTSFHSYHEVVTKFKEIVGGIGWYAHMIGFIMKLPVSLLSRNMARPNSQHFRAAKHSLRYLKGRLHSGITLRQTRKWGGDEFPEYRMYSDAGYVSDHVSAKSQVGYVGGFNGNACTTAASGMSNVVCSSTRHAEQYAASMTAREAMYKKGWHSEVGIRYNGPIKLFVDNSATVLAHEGAPLQKFSNATKHFRVYERYVTECVMRGDIIMIKMDGTKLMADAMTKALPRPALEKHRDQIEGTALQLTL